MAKYRFALLGAGWRANFYMRAVQERPDLFEITSVMARDGEKRKAFGEKWNVPVCGDVDALLATKPEFVVLLVSRDSMPVYIIQLTGKGMPVLAETPPAKDINALNDLFAKLPKGARAQVAEQYQFQPMHAARLAVTGSGILGRISHVQVSCAHGYHAISLIRKFLGMTYENAKINGYLYKTKIIQGPGRAGQPESEKLVDAEQTIALMDFDGRQALLDFCGPQYMSYIRGTRILARGERGEISHNSVRYLKSFNEPVFYDLVRKDMGQDGNLEGFFLKGVLGGNDWLYKNPMAPSRLYDDEIAVATCLLKMGEYANGGPSFYSLNEAAQDTYLDLLIQQSIASGSACVQSSDQSWIN